MKSGNPQQGKMVFDAMSKVDIPLEGETGGQLIDLLAYTDYLENRVLAQNPYRIGKRYPFKKSIEGLRLIFILKAALQVCHHLGLYEGDFSVPNLIADIYVLGEELRAADVQIVDVQKFTDNSPKEARDDNKLPAF